MQRQLDAGAVEDYVDYLISAGRVDEAAEQLAKAVNDDEYGCKQRSRNGTITGSLTLSEIALVPV